GAAAAFALAAALSLLATVLLGGIREPARPVPAQRHPLREISEGAAFVVRHAMLRPIFITQFIFNTASFVILSVFVPFAVLQLRQAVTPPSLLGRVSAINIMAYGARPLGAGIGAMVGGLYGAETCLYVAAALFFAQMIVIWLSPAIGLDRQPDMIAEPAQCARA